jgi:L-threonylcarbamoyladenylate synthase
MKTQLLSADRADSIRQALLILRAGGLVAFPTDTVYGVGALACDGIAVESIYVAKTRPAAKAIPILLGEAADLEQIASTIPEMAKRLAARFWPGPVTLVVPRNDSLPPAVSATGTVGARVPDHQFARALLRAAGPMAVTSANLSGEPNPTTAQEVFAQLGGRIALILDGGKTAGGIPSTLVDCTGSEPIILREGPLSLRELKSALVE